MRRSRSASRIGSATSHRRPRPPAFPVEALRDVGYVEGQNVVLEVREAAGKLEQLPALAAHLVRLRVDVIVAASPPAIQAAKEATTTIPIVMGATSIDPITSGFVRQPRPTRWKHHRRIDDR